MRSGSYIRLPSEIARHSYLTPTAKLVYAAMLAYQGNRPCCIASYQRIADRLSLNRRSVMRSIDQLHKAHLIRPAHPAELAGSPKGGYGNAPTNAWVCLLTSDKKSPVTPIRPVTKSHRHQ